MAARNIARLARLAFCAVALCALSLAAALPGRAASQVLAYHGTPDRNGNFIVPKLTYDAARKVHLDQSFKAAVDGHVYAQPLIWQSPAGSAVMIAATENNTVQAVDAETGSAIWGRSLGAPVARSALRCGDIDPLGVTGTPVIDSAAQTVYVEAATGGPSGVRHLVFGLSLKDGSVLSGWPVDVGAVLQAKGEMFPARDQDDRGALTILNGVLYVPFGGHFGDCGAYHGSVVGISTADPKAVTSWSTRARGGGIWAPGGISSDGQSLFVVTGNTFDTSSWADGEAVIRLTHGLARSTATKDFFAPTEWLTLDRLDADLGGTNALPFDLPAGSGTKSVVLALGKDGRAYLLDRTNLGGIGGSLATETVSTGAIRTGPAAYPGPDGTFVAFQGPGYRCPNRAQGDQLTVLKITAGPPAKIATAWCGVFAGAGAPIVTTTDGHSNPIVWVVGAEGDNRLHGFRGDTGEPLFTGGGAGDGMTGLHHFQTLIATDDRLYVGADGRIYAFAF